MYTHNLYKYEYIYIYIYIYTWGFHRRATDPPQAARFCFECAHAATCCDMLSLVTTCRHMLPHYVAHNFPCKLILGHCGTSVVTPFVLTPSGSCQTETFI